MGARIWSLVPSCVGSYGVFTRARYRCHGKPGQYLGKDRRRDLSFHGSTGPD
jgi:hypothetical protein